MILPNEWQDRYVHSDFAAFVHADDPRVALVHPAVTECLTCPYRTAHPIRIGRLSLGTVITYRR